LFSDFTIASMTEREIGKKKIDESMSGWRCISGRTTAC